MRRWPWSCGATSSMAPASDLGSDGPATPVAVLDLETRLSSAAASPGGRSVDVARSALHEVAAVCVLSFRVGTSGLDDLALWSGRAAQRGEHSLIAELDRALLPAWRGGGLLVTHNGFVHDVPVLLRRCAHHGMFHSAGIEPWAGAPERHRDTLRLWGGGALRDLCVGIGIPFPRVAATVPTALRGLVKCEVDVVATALLWLHREAFARGGVGWLVRCWADLGRFLSMSEAKRPHLLPIARRGFELARLLERAQ